MKILFITARFPYGPSEAFLLPEIRQVVALGHEALVFPVRPKGARQQEDPRPAGVSVHHRMLWSPRVLGRSLSEAVRSPRVARDVLPSMLTRGSLSTRLKNAAALPKALYAGWLARAWGAQHIHAYWAATSATVAMIAAEIADISWTFTAHRWELSELDILAAKLRAASGARLISASGRSLLEAALAREGLPPNDIQALTEKTRVIHLGVDIPETPSSRPSTQTILCPASLVPVKGHVHLLDAFALIFGREPRARLLIAGDGPLRSRLLKQARDLGLERQVQFLGQMARSDLLSMYARNQVSCVVMPSVVLGQGIHEGIPVSLLEAMSFGVPVVGTATGGIPELLDTGAGLLVPERNPEALADAVLRLLANHLLWKELSEKGRARVTGDFSAPRGAAELLQLMRSS